MSCPICHKKHSSTISEALSILAGTPGRIDKLTAGISPKKSAVRPLPDKWSAKEIVCHLADCELVFAFRYRKILSEPGSALVAFDQDAWAKALDYPSQPLKQVLSTFAAVRGSNVSLLKSVPNKAWNNTGLHPHYGTLSLRQFVLHIAAHDHNHTAQIEGLCGVRAGRRRAEKR